MNQRPTGTVTFLFSDIEGSTSRWDADLGAMTSALTRHDALMREALEASGGYTFKAVGDGFCVAFARPQDAILAALEAQRALASQDFSAVHSLRVRMALHTGTADERDGDYFGPTVNRVSRLLAIGHGGQVLVSGSAAQLLQHEMPAHCSLRDLGEHRLRDLARTEHVYQLNAEGLQDTFPALRSLDVLSNNLPRQLTSFVGREQVVSDITALIEKNALVTLVGTGGAGKTRCAIQAAAELLDGSGDGVWLAELAPIADPSLVANTIANVLNVQERPNHPMLESLVSFLKRKRLLLILDNCEHLIDEARSVSAAILRDCPQVRILATSREPLNISGEQVYRMPSLAVPDNADALIAEGSSRYGAVQLFVDRALSSDNRFTFTEENAPHIGEICRRLDGIPLAIELAAARVKVLSPQQLARRLDERFRVLTGGDRALPRQQTMRALIDWSYDLLSDDERTLFRKLSIFAGTFTLDTAADVCAEGAMDEIAVLDRLSSLVDKSLVQAETVADETRYRLLESTRQYAREKLNGAGEDVAVARAHARAFLLLAERFDSAYETTPDRAWIAQVEPEMDNFRSALCWAFGLYGEKTLGQQLAFTLHTVWALLSAAEGRRWVQTAQEQVEHETPAALVAGLDLAEAQLAGTLGHYKHSVTAGERTLARFGELDDPIRTALAERIVGRALAFTGHVEQGEALLRQALAEARKHGARKLQANVLENLALSRLFADDLAGARQVFNEALTVARTSGAERIAASVALNLAEAEARAGDLEAAIRLSRELTILRTVHDKRNVAVALHNTAEYLVALQDYEQARDSARQALSGARDTEWTVGLVATLQTLAAISALRSRPDAYEPEDRRRAARVLGYVDAQFEALDVLREHTEQREYEAVMSALRDTLGDDELATLMAEGRTWSEDRAVSEAMAV